MVKKSKKKITKKKSEKKKDMDKDKVLVYGLIILLLIFGAFIIGVRFIKVQEEAPQVEVKTYNGFVFEKYGNIWVTTIRMSDWLKGTERDYEILFHYTPDEVEHIPTIKNVRNESISPNLFLDARKIYITTDPEYPAEVVLSGVEIAKIIGQVYEKQVKAAVTRPDNRTEAPVITCDDLANLVRVIELRLGNETKIFSEHGCIVVQGTDPGELLKAAERLTFELLKIL